MDMQIGLLAPRVNIYCHDISSWSILGQVPGSKSELLQYSVNAVNKWRTMTQEWTQVYPWKQNIASKTSLIHSEERMLSCIHWVENSFFHIALPEEKRHFIHTLNTASGAELGQNYPPLLSPTYFRASAHGTINQIIYSLSLSTSLHYDSLPVLTHH